MNYSELSRKDQVLALLTEHKGKWVDGTELANERVGGSEGLRRLRELMNDNHPIESRRHPDTDRDIWQYRLLEQPSLFAPVAPEKPVEAWECPSCGNVTKDIQTRLLGDYAKAWCPEDKAFLIHRRKS